MATFTYAPDFGWTRMDQPNVQSAPFGDNYEQRLVVGAKDLRTYTLTFSTRDETEATNIIDFLKNERGSTSFGWTPPDGTAGKFLCRSWSRTQESYGLNTIGPVTFEEVNDN